MLRSTIRYLPKTRQLIRVGVYRTPLSIYTCRPLQSSLATNEDFDHENIPSVPYTNNTNNTKNNNIPLNGKYL